MGIDGSGKSSLAKDLQHALKEQNQRSTIVWACLRPVLLRPFILLAKHFLVKGHDKFENYDKHIEVKRDGMKRLSWTHGIYFAVMILDYYPQVFYKVICQRLLGKHVICDRYYHDLMLDYCAHINADSSRVLKLVRFSERLFPKPDFLYFVSIPCEIALQRKSDIPAISYLEERSRHYGEIASEFNSHILDGTKPLIENTRTIMTDMGFKNTGKLSE